VRDVYFRIANAMPIMVSLEKFFSRWPSTLVTSGDDMAMIFLFVDKFFRKE